MNRFRTILLQTCITLVMISIAMTVSAQHQPLDTLLKRFDVYRVAHSSEKIYAHLDKEFCLTGETLWFKFYLINETTHRPAGMSKVIYVELLDAVNRSVLQGKIAVDGGYGNGSLFIPASLTSGNYTFRAYTNWMKNLSPEYFFHRKVTVVNTFRKLELNKNKAAVKPTVRFFPEGGNLVTGIRSRVALQVGNNPDNEQLTISITADADTITRVIPDQYGMATFSFVPLADKQYRAMISREGRVLNTVALPLAQQKGYVMSLTDSTSDKLALKIVSSAAHSDGKQFYLIVHARNIISKASVHSLRQDKATIVIDKKDFREGISHITLFGEDLQPLCERLYFTPVNAHLALGITANQNEYGVRRKVALDITSATGKSPTSASLSLAIFKNDSLQHDRTDNFFRYIWLDADLTDVPALPRDFFDNVDQQKTQVLDNIMMINGWRRFKWEDVTGGKKLITFIPELRTHIINGVVTNDGRAVQNSMTYLSSPGLNIQLYGSISDAQGRVKWETKDFFGQRKVVVQTDLSADSTSRIELTSPFSDRFVQYQYKSLALIPAMEKQLSDRSIAMQVQDVFYQDRGALTRGTGVDTTAFYGKADETYYLDDYTRFPVMEEVMREYVKGVLVRKRRDGFHFINLDIPNKGVFDRDPFIMIDGIPVFDADDIMSFDPLKIKKLEVLTRRYYMGVMSLPGIASYTTYAGDLAGFQLDPKCLVIDYEGLQLQREFYTPTYETAKLRESRMPDQRVLLFWEPNARTDQNGKCHIEFFTSDVPGDYTVIVEGNNADGVAGSGVSLLKVRAFDN